MNFEVGKVIVLANDEEYVIVSIAEYNSKKYFYLINAKLNDVMFAYLDNDEIVKIDNIDELNEVMPLLSNNIQKYLQQVTKKNSEDNN